MNPARQPFGLRFWLVTLAALVAMVLTASLGRWQLSRAAQKTALQAAMDERQSRAPLQGAELAQALQSASQEATAPLLHRRAELRGQWLPEATVFLENRQMYGRPGFFVFTPLQLADSPRVVLVQRGWAPRNFLERRSPPLPDRCSWRGGSPARRRGCMSSHPPPRARGLRASGRIWTWPPMGPRPAWHSRP